MTTNGASLDAASDMGARALGRARIMSAAEAEALIADNATVAVGGFLGLGAPEAILAAIERRFRDTGQSPRALTLVATAATGDGAERGLNRLAHEGLVRRAVFGQWDAVPKLKALAAAGRIEAHGLPAGVIAGLFRDIGGRRAGLLTRVGLSTHADPRLGGGKLNAQTRRDLVELMTVDGEEVLRYRTFHIDVAIIRATSADEAGNLTLEREALPLEALALATAARASGGIVIAQVERVAVAGSLDPRLVKVPGLVVDAIVVAERPSEHMQTFAESFNPGLSGEIKSSLDQREPLKPGIGKLLARRAAAEIETGTFITFAGAMASTLAAVALEEDLLADVTLAAGAGAIGGLSLSGLGFGAALNAEASIELSSAFDLCEGLGSDLAVLELSAADAQGCVGSPASAEDRIPSGLAMSLSERAKKIVFVGTFTGGEPDLALEDGRLRIRREGKVRRFVKQVEARVFAGPAALKRGQTVLYVTERCVLKLTSGGLELTEVADGIDIGRDILAHMDFKPVIRTPRLMDPRLFRTALMGLARGLAAPSHPASPAAVAPRGPSADHALADEIASALAAAGKRAPASQSPTPAESEPADKADALAAKIANVFRRRA